jgi:hypothetical protein
LEGLPFRAVELPVDGVLPGEALELRVVAPLEEAHANIAPQSHLFHVGANLFAELLAGGLIEAHHGDAGELQLQLLFGLPSEPLRLRGSCCQG